MKKKILSCLLMIISLFTITGCEDKTEANKNNTSQKETIKCDEGFEIKDGECVKIENEIKEFTVTFETKGGNKIESIKVKENEKITKPKNPTKKGYKFVEWQLDNKKFDFNTEVSKDITLVAIWKKNSTTNATTNNNTNNNESTGNSNQNTSTTNNNSTNKKVCNEADKKEIEAEYNELVAKLQNTLNSYIKLKNEAEQNLSYSGGYISQSDYNRLYLEANSDLDRSSLDTQRKLSKIYETCNKKIDEMNNAINITNQKYQSTLRAMNCN